MSKKNRYIIIVLLLLLTPSLFSSQIRYFDYSNYTRFVVETGKKVDFKIDEERFTYTLYIQPAIKINPKQIVSKRIKNIEIKRENNKLEIKILLKKNFCFKLKTFTLNSPFRIVLDIYDNANCSSISGKLKKSKEDFSEENQKASHQEFRGEKQQIRYIVIDPGHGGSEYGAVGPSGVMEKDIVLSIAKYLKKEIESKLGLKVILTRSRDINLSLEERAQIANNSKADLFISIHCNASRNKKARGSETFILSLKATDNSARRTAYFENNPQAKEYKDENDTITFILWDLAQSAFLKESALLAELVQKELNLLLHTKDRGIKQAPFRVLTNVSMPAILVETAFLSNPDEEKMLKDPKFQKKIAYAIFLGVKRYIEIVSSR